MNDFDRLYDYYASKYTKSQRKGIQGWGNSLIDVQLDKLSKRDDVREEGGVWLEIGASSGEHFYRFSRINRKRKVYIGVDLMPGVSDPELFNTLQDIDSGIVFIAGDVSNLPFLENSIDVIISTCVMAHVINPEKVFLELRRVLKPKGSLTVVMPCDPGILNRFIKVIITYRQMKKNGVLKPRLTYALGHVNSINNLIEIAKDVFENDDIKFNYLPFKLSSWNFNLFVSLRVKKI